MYDFEKLTPEELEVLATYILPYDYPATDLFDQMLTDLKPLGIRKLKGTIGAIKGRFFSDRFLKSPYWQIISAHYRKQGNCPLCHQNKTLVIYSPAYHHLGINHLHPEDHLLTCEDCHHAMNQFFRDYRFWKPLKAQEDYEVGQFLTLLRKFK